LKKTISGELKKLEKIQKRKIEKKNRKLTDERSIRAIAFKGKGAVYARGAQCGAGAGPAALGAAEVSDGAGEGGVGDEENVGWEGLPLAQRTAR
jgi:hypothetical protein